jgi:hypothetical protein
MQECQLGLIVGNGFTIDYYTQFDLKGLNPSSPTSWDYELPSTPKLTPREAFPNFFPAFDEIRAKNPDVSEYDILRMITELGESEIRIDVETRQFLSLTYRLFTGVLETGPIQNWRWKSWIDAYRKFLRTTVSFNYDLLLEYTLSTCAISYCRMHSATWPIVRIFKPHGSADFDISGLTRDPLSYPLRVFARMNNGPLKIHSAENNWLPPSEALIVLPYECNPYINYQWVAPGYSKFTKLGSRLTHLVFLGLSYHPADRNEIDRFLFSTSKDCLIIVASPNPNKDFLKTIQASGREVQIWQDGPKDLPLRSSKFNTFVP